VQRLQKTERSDRTRSIPGTVTKGPPGEADARENLYQVGLERRIQPYPDRRWRRMENRLCVQVWIVRVLNDAIWTEERACDIPAVHEFDHKLYKSVVAYLDDVVVFSSTAEEHKTDVQEVLNSFAKQKLLLKPSNCVFDAKKVDFLGFVVQHGRLKASPSRIRAITECAKDSASIEKIPGLRDVHARIHPQLCRDSKTAV
jgi:hypothetical protein